MRNKKIMDVIGDKSMPATEIIKQSGISRDLVYYVLAHLTENHYLNITKKLEKKKGFGWINHYSASGFEFIPKTVEQLERMYPVGYFGKLRHDQRSAVVVDEKGPYDDMIAANPNLRKIAAIWETRPELFKQEKRKTEHRGIPSTFGMFDMAA